MNIIKNQWFQLISTFSLGLILGVWQLLPNANGLTSSSLISNVAHAEMDELVYRNTAEIEPLLNLKAPDRNASVNDWYHFAVSLDDLDLGERYGNSDSATPVLSWYTLIAKYKPQALYKLYNQGKLNEYKFEHLLRYGYLKYWDESVQNVDNVLLKNNQAVLTMAYNKGVEEARQRVKEAFFKLANIPSSMKEKHTLDIEILLFAMKSMSTDEKTKVQPILESGAYKIDPVFLYRLKFDETFKDESIIVSLIEKFSKSKTFTNLERDYSNNKVLSSYMTDSVLLGSDRYLQTMIDDVEFNENQPIDEYCAACGLALSTEGLIAYPLINAAKQSNLKQYKHSDEGFILSRKDAQ